VFDDPNKIQSIQSISIPEIEVLYWKIEDSLSSGQIKKAKMFFEMLCYIASHRKDVLNLALKDAYRTRLRAISYEICGKNVPYFRKPVIEKSAIEAVETPFEKEKQLNNYLYQKQNLLCDALKTTGRVTGREVEVDEYKCDLIFENSSVLFAIELKKDQADHKAVSQLDKYCHYFYLKLRYNLFKEVKGAIIANGFSKWSINEFRRKGRFVFYMCPTSKKDIQLRQIT